MAVFTAVDLETTGLNPAKDKIIEIGAVKVVDGKTVDTFSMLINPKMSIPCKITEITGIDDEMVADAPGIQKVLEEFYDFVEEDDLLGHNLLFDYSFLKTQFFIQGINYERKGYDTLRIAKKMLPQLKSRSLGALCDFYGLKNLCAHRAFEDASVTAQLYFQLEKQFKIGNESIFQPALLQYKIKKEEPITMKQKKYLIDLLKCHRIKIEAILPKGVNAIEEMTKSQGSKAIDFIILHYGRLY